MPPETEVGLRHLSETCSVCRIDNGIRKILELARPAPRSDRGGIR